MLGIKTWWNIETYKAGTSLLDVFSYYLIVSDRTLIDLYHISIHLFPFRTILQSIYRSYSYIIQYRRFILISIIILINLFQPYTTQYSIHLSFPFQTTLHIQLLHSNTTHISFLIHSIMILPYNLHFSLITFKFTIHPYITSSHSYTN